MCTQANKKLNTTRGMDGKKNCLILENKLIFMQPKVLINFIIQLSNGKIIIIIIIINIYTYYNRLEIMIFFLF